MNRLNAGQGSDMNIRSGGGDRDITCRIVHFQVEEISNLDPAVERQESLDYAFAAAGDLIRHKFAA